MCMIHMAMGYDHEENLRQEIRKLKLRVEKLKVRVLRRVLVGGGNHDH
mgnify:CR=1 FL=1